jgi:hypothetical protein
MKKSIRDAGGAGCAAAAWVRCRVEMTRLETFMTPRSSSVLVIAAQRSPIISTLLAAFKNVPTFVVASRVIY